MDPVLGGLLFGGLLGAGKYAGNVAGNESDKKRAATTEKWSPWTHQTPNAIRHANMITDILPEVGMGAALGGSDLGKSIFGAGTLSPWAAAANASGEGAGFGSEIAGYGPTAAGAPTGLGYLGRY